VDSCKFTDFGLCVKTELLRRGKEQKWLIEEIKARGMYADSGYLYKIFTGQRCAPSVVQIIKEILDLPVSEPTERK
jgi:hypothetical protein